MSRFLGVAALLAAAVLARSADAQVGGVAAPSQVAIYATGTTVPRTLAARFGDVLNVRDFGAQGNAVTVTGGVVAAGGNVLTASVSCTAADVGKAIILHGSGAGGVAQSGTITACSGKGFVTSFTAVQKTPWSGIWTGSTGQGVGFAAAGSGYVPGDTVTAVGGTLASGPAASWTLAQTRVVSAAVVAGGTGGTTGACTVTGTTGAAGHTAAGGGGAGSRFSATGTVSGGALTGALTITVAGDYTVNPTSLTSEPVTGCGLVGATVSLAMGADLAMLANAGNYSSMMATPFATTDSGAGTGATILGYGHSFGGTFTYGADDTAAVAAAIAAASAAGKSVRFPGGTYWLASQSTPITLANVALVGDGPVYSTVPAASGSSLLISNTATAAFYLGSRVSVSGLTFSYPAQDGIGATPTTYPALFENSASLTIEGDEFNDNVFVNPFVMLKVDDNGGSAIGRVWFRNNRMNCISKCLWLTGGAADIIAFDSANMASIGIAMDYTGQWANYESTQGEFIRVDIGSASYKSLDGLLLDGMIIYGYRYGLRILSGGVAVSEFLGTRWDTVSTVLSIEGAAYLAISNFVGGYVWSTPVADIGSDVFSISSTSALNSITISGLTGGEAQGNWLTWTGAGGSLTLTGSYFGGWGHTMLAGANSGAYAATWYMPNGSASAAQLTLNGNHFDGTGGSSTRRGVMLGSTTYATLTGNTITNTYVPVYLQGAVGTTLLTGNASSQTGYTNAVYDANSGTAVAFEASNIWDKPSTKYHGDPMSSATGIVAHAGGGQVSATLLTAYSNEVSTVATAADSVLFPVASGRGCITVTDSGANALTAYGNGSNTINGAASVTLAAGKTGLWCSTTTGKWAGGSFN